MTADVVIVTWNSGERVLRCLERVLREQPPERVFVVDNASADGTVEGARRAFPAVHVIELDANRGFGAAVNAGVELGGGEAIVLINDDVEIEPGFMAAILEPFGEEHCGMVAAMTTIPGRPLVDGFGIELDVTLAAYNRLRREAPSAPPGRLAMPSGGAAAYRRVAFERAGGFDECLFAYGEDVDLGLRLRLDGWSAADAAAARGVHQGGASIGVDSPHQRALAGFARGFLLRRYGVLRSRHAVRALALESAVVGWGLARHRTLIPLRARVRGWRTAEGARLRPPVDAIDRSISVLEAVRRLRHGR